MNKCKPDLPLNLLTFYWLHLFCALSAVTAEALFGAGEFPGYR